MIINFVQSCAKYLGTAKSYVCPKVEFMSFHDISSQMYLKLATIFLIKNINHDIMVVLYFVLFKQFYNACCEKL